MEQGPAPAPRLLEGFRAFQGFALDLALNALAIAVAWHPVYDWLTAHQKVLLHGLVGLHLFLVPAVFVLIIAGHARGSSFLLENRASFHERAFIWSSVGAIGLSFIVPGVMSLAVDVLHVAFLLAATIGPLLLIFASGFALVMLERRRPGFRLPNPFATLGGTVAFAALVWVYEATTETVMFLARERDSVLSGDAMVLAGVVGYLSMRLFLFYSVARYRAEMVSVVLTTCHLTLRLLAARPGE